MRIVADTNTLVSGFGWSGAPAQVVDAALAGRIVLISSPPLLDELTRVLAYPKLAKVFDDPEAIVTLVASIADMVYPETRLAVVADEPDNRVLEAADIGQADAIVTGDRALRALGTFHGIPILTAAELISRLGQDSGEDSAP